MNLQAILLPIYIHSIDLDCIANCRVLCRYFCHSFYSIRLLNVRKKECLLIFIAPYQTMHFLNYTFIVINNKLSFFHFSTAILFDVNGKSVFEETKDIFLLHCLICTLSGFIIKRICFFVQSVRIQTHTHARIQFLLELNMNELEHKITISVRFSCLFALNGMCFSCCPRFQSKRAHTNMKCAA